jgi:hypothetical protein
MKTETIERLERELKQSYRGVLSATDAGRRLVKLPEVYFPRGCRPEVSEALVVLDPAADKPEFYLSVFPTLASGAVPARGQIFIGGQNWNTFSYSLQHWQADENTAEQFVEGKLRRFALAT